MSHHLPPPYICLITRDAVLSRVVRDILKFVFPLNQFQTLESFSELDINHRGIVLYDRQTIPMPNKGGEYTLLN